MPLWCLLCTWHCSKHYTNIHYSNPQTEDIITIIAISILQMMKLKHKRFSNLFKGHTSTKWQKRQTPEYSQFSSRLGCHPHDPSWAIQPDIQKPLFHWNISWKQCNQLKYTSICKLCIWIKLDKLTMLELNFSLNTWWDRNNLPWCST